jgi:Amt family ammonium transporter
VQHIIHHADAYVLLLCPLPRSFGLAFGESVNGSYGIFGNPSKYGLLHNVGAAPDAALAANIPLSLFALFQGAFAIITPALLIGSVADR